MLILWVSRALRFYFVFSSLFHITLFMIVFWSFFFPLPIFFTYITPLTGGGLVSSCVQTSLSKPLSDYKKRLGKAERESEKERQKTPTCITSVFFLSSSSSIIYQAFSGGTTIVVALFLFFTGGFLLHIFGGLFSFLLFWRTQMQRISGISNFYLVDKNLITSSTRSLSIR